MEGDSDLEDYDLTVKDGIVPRTGAEERRMVDENNDQDMNAFTMTEQTLSSQTMMDDKLMEEGGRSRQFICRDPVQSQRPISMQAPSRPLAEILQLIPKEDAEQVNEFQGLVYMPEHFLEKYLIPSMQLRKILDDEEDTVGEDFSSFPGGQETALLYSLFRHTKDTKDVEDLDKLRALIAHANEQTPQQVLQVRENMMSKTIYLESFVHQLRDATLLPPTRVIYQMTPSEINDKNQLIDDVLTNFEAQLKRDYKSFESARQQNVLITKLNYEQQLHIHDLNLESFNVSNQ
jgi:hypothetical protein